MDGNGLQIRRLSPQPGGSRDGVVLCDAAGRMLPGQQKVTLVTSNDADALAIVTFVVDGSYVTLALAEEAVERTIPEVGGGE